MRKNNRLSVFPGSMVSGKVSSRSKNDPLCASNDKFEVATRTRSGAAPHTDLEVKYFHNVDESEVLAAISK